MSDQLPVDVQVVLSHSSAQSGDVDGYVDDTKEGQSEHGWNGTSKCTRVDTAKLCSNVSVWSFDFTELLTEVGVEPVKLDASFWHLENPSSITHRLQVFVQDALDNKVEDSEY